jgi:hypothetical protein
MIEDLSAEPCFGSKIMSFSKPYGCFLSTRNSAVETRPAAGLARGWLSQAH